MRLICDKRLFITASLGLPAIENASLRDTMRGIRLFFRRYDLHFFAHQIPTVLDYQLSHAVPDSFLGIEYIVEYLRRLIIENDFLRRFEPALPISRSALRAAAVRLCRALYIRDPAALAYLESTASDLYPRIAAALPYGGLSGIFLSVS
jgi:hypothetical protein